MDLYYLKRKKKKPIVNFFLNIIIIILPSTWKPCVVRWWKNSFFLPTIFLWTTSDVIIITVIHFFLKFISHTSFFDWEIFFIWFFPTAQDEIRQMSVLSAKMLHPGPPIITSPYVPIHNRNFSPSYSHPYFYSHPGDSIGVSLPHESPRQTRASSPVLERRKT